MKILVTGGGGYLGSVLVGHLLQKKHSVVVVDNLMHGSHGLYPYCSDRSFDFVRGDARDPSLMKQILHDKDVLIPLAAIVGMPACDLDPVTALSTNTEAIATMNRLRSTQQCVIYPCTNSGYGARGGNGFCTEETPLLPISLYGKTKVDAEKLLLESPNVITLRLATVFGVSGRMRLDLLVNDFTYRAVRDRFLVLYEPRFKRNYLHIRDAADAFCHAIDHFDSMKGEPYNVGLDSANMTKLELAEKIRSHVPGLYIHVAEVGKDPDKRNYVVSNEKIRKKGFEARRTLDEGIQELIRACRMLPRSQTANL